MRLLPLALTLCASLLVGCPDRTRGPDDPQDDDDDDSAGEGEVRTWYRDDDGDGWGREGNIAETVEQPTGFVDRFGDCDDLDATVHPEAEEICDQRDNDCDEQVDEDLDDLELFADGDGDSYGDDGDALLSCDPVDGYVPQGGDCDDGEASVHPGAQELCNDRDDDCDGSADADHPDAIDWYADLDGDGFGDPADATSACAQPDGRLADDQDCDDSDATIHPGADEVCDDGIDQNCDGLADDGCTVVHCGDITADETWTAGVVHVVTCDVFVDDPTDPTLTVQDGAIVRFAAGAELFTGYDDPGRLVVNGSSSGVLFTPHVSVALPGSWPGVSLWNQDSGSILTGLTVEYGGDNGQGNIRVNDAEPILDGVLSRYSSEAGLQANLGSLTITNSSFVDNDGAGVDLFGPVLLAGFDGNTLAGNTEPIVLGAAALGALDSTSTFVGNFYDRVRVLGGDVQDSALWTDPGVPVLVQGDVYVGGMPPITLELDDGLEVLFETGRALRIGSGGDAELLVSGGASGVLFTSSDATPAPGDWRGLMFSAGTLPSTLSGLTLEYAGHSGTSTILLDSSVGAQVTLSEVISRSGAAWGLEVQNGSVSVAASAFEDHALGGVLVGSAGELAVGSGARSFIGNTITGNVGPALELPADEAGQVDPAITVSGNGDDRVLVAGTVATTDAWAALPVAWSLDGDVRVAGSSAPVLTIEDGALLEFEQDAALKVGLGGAGGLVVAGSTSGVTFTSAATTPAPGDWQGVTFWNMAQDPTITGLTVEYGGGNGYGNLYLFGPDGTITGGTNAWSAAWGIYRASGADPAISGVTFTGNTSGEVY